jgi:Protein of unknown function (DUF4232)
MTRFSPVPRPVLAGLALLLAGFIAGCGSGTPAAAPATTVTVTPSAPASSAPASASGAAASPSTGSTTTGGSAPAACPTRSLAVKAGLSQGAAGSIYQVVDFSNISDSTCTLYGFPGVSLAGGSPVKQIGLAAAEDHSSARVLITLAPGAVANALLRIVQAANFPPSRCDLKNATFLQIYPPNQTTPVYLKYKAQACAKPVQILTVSVVKAGSGGS